MVVGFAVAAVIVLMGVVAVKTTDIVESTVVTPISLLATVGAVAGSVEVVADKVRKGLTDDTLAC